MSANVAGLMTGGGIVAGGILSEPLPPPLADLAVQEELLRYPEHVGAREALDLGCIVAALAHEYDRGVGVRIYRERDDLVLFQWMMDDKGERNLGFIDGKRLCAQRLGHASLWAVAAAEYAGGAGLPALRANECRSGGAFPLRTGAGDWEATICLSGLHQGRDHELVVRALCIALGRRYGVEVPAYRGVAR